MEAMFVVGGNVKKNAGHCNRRIEKLGKKKEREKQNVK